MSRLADKQEVFALFLTAGLPVERLWELPNGYWPDGEKYDDIRTPWWLCRTSIGLIRVGWRKKVLDIDWTDTGIESIVTTDKVTKNTLMVHAWTMDKAVAYLIELRRQAGTRTIDIDPDAPYPEYGLPEDLVDSAVRHICTVLYGDSDEAKACDEPKRKSLVGDSVRIAMRATLARASSDLNKTPTAPAGLS